LKGLSRCQNRRRRPSEAAIRACLAAVNADRTPFRWTKSADAILGALKRFRLRTLDFASSQAEIAGIRTLVFFVFARFFGKNPVPTFCRAPR
jgi:hypothetical protein